MPYTPQTKVSRILPLDKIKIFKRCYNNTRSYRNTIFTKFHCDKKIINSIQKKFYFYMRNENILEIRLMNFFDTNKNDIQLFIERLKKNNLK